MAADRGGRECHCERMTVGIEVASSSEGLEGGERGEGGGSGTQKFVYQKWPDQIFPFVNFVFSHDGHFGLEGGGGVPPSSYGVWPFSSGHCFVTPRGGGGGFGALTPGRPTTPTHIRKIFLSPSEK